MCHTRPHIWRRQDLIDRGFEPGSGSKTSSGTMGRSIVGSENRVTELAVTKRAIELLKGKVVSPKDGTG